MITYTTVENGCQGTIVDYRDLFLVQAVQTNDTAGYVVELVFKFVDKGCIYKHQSNIFTSDEEANKEVERINSVIYKEQHKHSLTLSPYELEILQAAVIYTLRNMSLSKYEKFRLENIREKIKEYYKCEYGTK
jgi:hypothetical protein